MLLVSLYPSLGSSVRWSPDLSLHGVSFLVLFSGEVGSLPLTGMCLESFWGLSLMFLDGSPL